MNENNFYAKKEDMAKDQIIMAGLEMVSELQGFFNHFQKHDGGKIVCTKDLSPEEIQAAREDNRLLVINSIGFVFLPPSH